MLVSGGGGNPPASDGGRLQRQELFISYSRKDRAFLEQFWTHLKPLETLYWLQRWDDSRIKPGAIWLEEIEQALIRAQVALLLVSPDFLASDFIQRKELPSLFDAAKKDGLTILWLPIRPCSWKRYPQIEQYQSVGSVNPTLAEMGEVERDRVMVGITDHIHDLFERIENERQAARQAAEAEALARRQEEERQIAEQEVERLAEEPARLERLQAKHEARAAAERWKAEAQRLAREKEELHRQVNLNTPQPTQQPEVPYLNEPQLIQIPAIRGWLVQEGKEWRKKEEQVKVLGYREELADGISITMIQIPAGEFLMGSPHSKNDSLAGGGPCHLVVLDKFFLGQTQVTQEQWRVVAGWPIVNFSLDPEPSRFRGRNRPVEQVSWHEALEFCQRLRQRSLRPYVLPSESQWEYTCRAGSTTSFGFGETLASDIANYSGNISYESGPKGIYREQTTDVKTFPANSWGLYDMHGNVSEWCLHEWHDRYEGAPTYGSAWSSPDDHPKKLLRGGSWANCPGDCSSFTRHSDDPKGISCLSGFRICLSTGHLAPSLHPTGFLPSTRWGRY